MAAVGLVVGLLLAGVVAIATADRNPAFGCWWFGLSAIACAVQAVFAAAHGDWPWAAWMAFLAVVNGLWWRDSFRRWRRRRRALAAAGAKSRARLQAVVAKHRAAQRRTRPVLRPVPGAAA